MDKKYKIGLIIVVMLGIFALGIAFLSDNKDKSVGEPEWENSHLSEINKEDETDSEAGLGEDIEEGNASVWIESSQDATENTADNIKPEEKDGLKKTDADETPKIDETPQTDKTPEEDKTEDNAPGWIKENY